MLSILESVTQNLLNASSVKQTVFFLVRSAICSREKVRVMPGALCTRIQVERVRSTAGVDCAYGNRREKPGGRFRAGIVPARRR